jgi:heat shock protein HtpX
MANLYTHKESNIRKTWLLFAVFFGLIMGLGWVFSYVYQDQGILIIAILFSIGTSFMSYWYSDKIALSMAGARQIQHDDNEYLYNMIENLAITAGLPTPRVYITPEIQINAFATGRNEKHSAVAVTQGALQKLNKTELEGVLAHEMSHIGNKDILISTVAVVLAGIIVMASDFFTRSMIFGGRRRENNEGGGFMLIIGLVVSLLAPLGATLMRLAISRKRELLADASGALLTRYPEGLASALLKISQDSQPMEHASNATAHLWISNPFKNKANAISKLFMTHPPIEERVAALRGIKINEGNQ